MKKLFPLLFFIVFLPSVLISAGNITFKSSDFLNFDVRPEAYENLKKLPELQSASQILPFNVNKSFTEKIYSSKPDSITIEDFPITAEENSEIILNKDKFNPFQHTGIIAYRDGKHAESLKKPEFTMYSGIIKGQENSYVSLVVVYDHVYAYIEQNDGSLTQIAPYNRSNDNLHYLTPHELNPNVSANERETYSCLTKDYVGSKTESLDILKYRKDKLLEAPKLLQVDILCEAAYDYYVLLGKNDSLAAEYIMSIMAMTSKIYLQFLNVKLNISEIVLRTTADSDPYQSDADLSQKLFTMPDVWSQNPKKRSLVVLFSDLGSQPEHTVVAGISMGGDPFIGSLCNNNMGYCALGIKGFYSYPTNRYTWDVNVAAHEIGHNFSAPHTHNCYFYPDMIDTCVTQLSGVWDACVDDLQPIPRPGTIMSYCHVTNSTNSVKLIFHPREIPLMRTAAEDCGCSSVYTDNFLSLTYPLGDTIYRIGNGNKITVHWSSAGIQNINIYIRFDTLELWDMPITQNYPAAEGYFTFDVPNYPVSKAYIIIRSSDDSTLFDSSIDPFGINVQKIEFTTPINGDGYSNNEAITPTWKKNFNDFVKLDFTSDGGNNWKTLAQSIQVPYFQLDSMIGDFPKCQFKLTSLEDASVAFSPEFSIGKASAKIIFPNGGEVVSANDSQYVKWESKNLHDCFIEYSTNNGSTWRFTELSSIYAGNGKYLWKVPKINCDSALVRIKTSSGKNVIDQSDAIFKIRYDSLKAVNDKPVLLSEIRIENIAPNPANERVEIRIGNTSDIPKEIEIAITDEAGRYSAVLGKFMIEGQSYLIKSFSTSDLSSGNYFVTLKIKNNSVESYPLKIVK